MATVATRRENNDVPRTAKIPLTPTGLLMEGDYTNYNLEPPANRSWWVVSVIAMLRQLSRSRARKPQCHDNRSGRPSRELSRCARTGELAAIVTIRMFVAKLPVCSLLRSVKFVKGTISFTPFSPPTPIPAVFAVIPLMIIPVVPVVIPPLVPFLPLSGILTTVVLKLVGGLQPYRDNKSHTQQK